MGEGPIPWTAIYQYGKIHLELDDNTFSMLEDVIENLDREYLNWRAESQKTS